MAKLYFWYGAMEAGKSIELIKAAYNYENRGMHPLVFNFALDNRYGTGKVASRSGISMPSQSFSSGTSFTSEILKFQNEKGKLPDCIFIDEAQFLSATQVEELANVAIRMNIPVMCYGIKTNFKSELFEGSKRLLELAQTIEEIKTICWCQKKATMNARVVNGLMVDEGSEISIGGSESYVSLCLEHFINKTVSKNALKSENQDS